MFGRGREKRSSRFLRSQSIRDGKFVGMMCDEDNQYDLSEGRAQAWVEQLKAEGIEM